MLFTVYLSFIKRQSSKDVGIKVTSHEGGKIFRSEDNSCLIRKYSIESNFAIVE